MKNKILKTLLVLGVLFFIIVGGVLAVIVYSLPSTKKISQAFTGRSDSSEKSLPQISTISNSSDQTAGDGSEAVLESSDSTTVSEEPKGKSSLDRKGIDNLIDPNRPLSDFCGSLKNAKQNVNSNGMSPSEFNTQFKNSVEGFDLDPRIQAFKPLLRTIFREPKMQELITEATNAVEKKEENFWQKAAFYSKAAMAFQAMIANKAELNAVGDRSYLFFKMTELVAKKPELLNDQRIQKFCADTESAFNTNQPVQFDQEKKNFERIMDEVGVRSEDIKYDPNYKSNFDVNFDGKSLQIDGGWLEELVTAPPAPSAKQTENQ
jgi:hypothetical protein